MVKLDGLRPPRRFVTRTCLKINVKNENPKKIFLGKHQNNVLFLCSSYFVCLSLTEGLRIFHHFTVYTLPDFTTLCRGLLLRHAGQLQAGLKYPTQSRA